jgi:predicted phage terminase large subunit-like protein
MPKPSLTNPAVRREITRASPLLFAQIYMRRHITGPDGSITFAECHREWAQLAKQWMQPANTAAQHRNAFLAPRATGKSTWWLLILPMWAAAHGHSKFAAFFADTYSQAVQHAATFRRELETNEFLRHDFPDLCAPAKAPGGMTESNSRDLMIRRNGFILTAKGMDSGALGMKVGEKRPDLLLLDDIEPDEASYSAALAEKRLGTLLDAILPLNIYARVVLSGTVTMPDSITHQIVKHCSGASEIEWVKDAGFTLHHAKPFLINDDGTRRSQWPHKWPLDWLEQQEHKREFAKNYLNDPLGADGDYWTKDSFSIGEDLPTRMMISVDPAVTVKESSDYTGVAVVGYNRQLRRCTVFECLKLKLGPAELREKLIALCDEYPLVTQIYIETNQGGDLWRHTLHSMPVKVTAVTSSIKKEVRAAHALARYENGKVLHLKPMRDLEEQMVSFPKAPHDDMVDAVCQAVNYYIPPIKKRASFGVPQNARSV